eukprot:TRINITY_DN454_c0_g1_i2.p1 TRINITY_DN454_c0_g1~~TRINITY_DN454_c0_g1_i2.p1  ORF type:complete len:107 (-),score=26.42 TRINITY_DN454_c0_g1_i2:62-382(-)
MPSFVRLDTPSHFVWKIRNISFGTDAFSVFVDSEKDEIVVKTSNKKYYRRIEVPDLRRFKIHLDDEQVDWEADSMTVTITYPKPRLVLEDEKKERMRCHQLLKKKE